MGGLNPPVAGRLLERSGPAPQELLAAGRQLRDWEDPHEAHLRTWADLIATVIAIRDSPGQIRVHGDQAGIQARVLSEAFMLCSGSLDPENYCITVRAGLDMATTDTVGLPVTEDLLAAEREFSGIGYNTDIVERRQSFTVWSSLGWQCPRAVIFSRLPHPQSPMGSVRNSPQLRPGDFHCK